MSVTVQRQQEQPVLCVLSPSWCDMYSSAILHIRLQTFSISAKFRGISVLNLCKHHNSKIIKVTKLNCLQSWGINNLNFLHPNLCHRASKTLPGIVWQTSQFGTRHRDHRKLHFQTGCKWCCETGLVSYLNTDQFEKGLCSVEQNRNAQEK